MLRMEFDLNALGERLRVEEEQSGMKGATTEEEHGPTVRWDGDVNDVGGRVEDCRRTEWNERKSYYGPKLCQEEWCVVLNFGLN